MIPLLSVLVLAPQGPLFADAPVWLAGLLREAPPSRPSMHFVHGTPHPGGGVVVPPNAIDLGVTPMPPPPAHPGPDPWTTMQRRAAALIARGEYGAAYRLEEEGHDDPELFGSNDALTDAALLTGRWAEAQTLMVQQARLFPGGRYYDLRLCLASAAQGRLYPGQGAWLLAELREAVAARPDEKRLAGRYWVPATPGAVVGMSALAVGVAENDFAYLEWALRLDPRSELAAGRLLELYGYRHRTADAARVAASMVKALPPGPARDGFAAKLKTLQGSADAKGTKGS